MRLIHYRSAIPNFGDDLNAILWPALLPDFFDDDAPDGFVGIGTLIGMPVPGTGRLTVFSSGAGYDALSGWQGRAVTYACVRGPVTARLLGLGPEAALTDGAILAPLTPGFPDAGGGGDETLVVPHVQSLAFNGWDEAARLAGFGLVDPRDPPEAVVARIARAGLVLTESLHGAIIADSYGVPWIGFASSKNFGATKWVDWRLSLDETPRFHILPPPDARAWLRFGRPAWPLGAAVELDAEQAMAAFAARVAPAAGALGWRQRLKRLAAGSAAGRALLGCSPARTAAALTALSLTARPCGSRRGLREELQERMLARLRAFTRPSHPRALRHDVISGAK